MKALIVLSLEVPDPESIVDALTAVNPPTVPHFAGMAYVVPEPHASEMIAWLEETKP